VCVCVLEREGERMNKNSIMTGFWTAAVVEKVTSHDDPPINTHTYQLLKVIYLFT